MIANDLLSLSMQLLFILLSIVTTLSYLRRHNKTRRDIALMFSSLGLTFAIQEFVSLTGTSATWLNTLALILLVSQPYLLLRLVHYFQPVPLLLRQVAGIGMVIAWIAFALAQYFVPSAALIALLAIILYFVAVDAYAMLAFVRGAFTTSGVVRQRLRFAAAGSGLLSLALFGLALAGLIPSQSDLITTLVFASAAASGISYYIGFATPRWLSRAWQMGELRQFLLYLSQQPIQDRLSIDHNLNALCHTATRGIGGVFAVVAQWDDDKKQWKQVVGSDATEPIIQAQLDKGSLMQIWHSRTTAFIRLSDNLNELDRQLLQQVGSEKVLLAPILIGEQYWGLLLVFVKHQSLFIEDDLELLALLTQQVAMFLENAALVEQLHHYSEELERRVNERTQALQESQRHVLRLNTELEQRVIERTTELSAVNRELEAFSYSVSHDLRAPLRSIDGFSQVMLEDYGEKLDQQGQNYLHRVRAAAQRMAALIDDLISLSRITRSEMERETVDLNRVLLTLMTELEEAQPERQVEWIVAEPLIAEGDSHLLRIVFENLVRNAWKFTQKTDQPCIEVGITQWGEDQNCVYFVRDNGAGFDMTYADKLFGAFQRLHTSAEFEGTGIGLATVQRIIHRHGGHIWAEGTVNQGATFYFTLSAAQQKEEAILV